MDASTWLEAHEEKHAIGSPYLERRYGLDVRALTTEEARLAWRQEAQSAQAHTHTRKCSACGALISERNTTGRCSDCQHQHTLRERRRGRETP